MKMTSISAAVVAALILMSSSGRAADCHNDGDAVTVVGIIHMKTLPPDPDFNRKRSWTYPVMTLDQPVCVKDGGFGAVPNGKVTSVIFTPDAKRQLTEGQHVSLQGRLSVRNNGGQPPEPLLLSIGN